MAKIIDFNALEQPTIEVVLRDEARTKITVTAPDLALIEKLQANSDSIKAACSTKDLKAVNEAYNLAAEFMSCNQEGIKLTGEELRTKYGVTYALLFIFIMNYLEFIDEIKNAKNS